MKLEICLKDQSALDYFNQLIIILNPFGQVVQFNSQTVKTLGFSKKQLSGISWETFLATDAGADQATVVNKFLKSKKKSVEVKLVLKTRSGSDCHLAFRISKLFDKSSMLHCILMSGINFTEKHFLLNQFVSLKQQNHKALIELEETLKKEFAHELHDNLSQQLMTCKLLLEIESNNKPSSELVVRAFKILTSAMADVRKMSHSLSFDKLGNKNLKQAIQKLANTINLSGKTTISTKFYNTREINLIPSIIAVSVYRIAQEHITNILKYAKASKVQIGLFLTPSSLDIEITDNGQGFDKQAIIKGIGLRSIYQRVALLQGMAYLATTPGDGCTLSVCIPLGNFDFNFNQNIPNPSKLHNQSNKNQ